MFHELATEKTRKYVEQFPEIKKGLTEICHALQFQVLTHNETHMKNISTETEALFNTNSESGQRRIRNSLRFLLIDSFKMPIGCFYVTEGTSRNGAYATSYCFMSGFISKERGRGSDRHTRDSINLPMLIKTLKKEYAQEHSPDTMITVMGNEMGSSASRRIDSALNDKYHRIDLSSDTELALINMYFNHTIITDDKVINNLNKAKKTLESMEKDKNAAEEAKKPFKEKVNFILHFDECPMMIGTAIFDKESPPYMKYGIHPDVNYYLSPDHVPETYKQLLVDYKMWYIKNERTADDNRIIEHTQFKVLPFSREKYDSDLGIVTDSGSKHVLGSAFNSYRMFISPVLVTDEVTNAE